MQQHDYALDIAVNSILENEGKIFSYSVDLGSGEGSLGYLLKSFTRWLIGVDVNPNFLNIAYESGDYGELVLADIFSYEIPIETDSIFCFEVIEHFPKDDGIKLFEDLLALAPSKFIMVSTPKTFFPDSVSHRIYELITGSPSGHLSLWTPEDFFNLGFHDVYIIPNADDFVAVRRKND